MQATTTTQDTSTKPSTREQRVEDCRKLYLAYHGTRHEEIERRMRALGHTRFNRRVLYTRNQYGRSQPGWPERFGWIRPSALAEAASQPSSPKAVQTGKEPKKNRGKERRLRKKGTRSTEDLRSATRDPQFSSWLRAAFPHMRWDFPYQQYLCETLQKFTDGEIDRLMIFMPPRHGKSELVTRKYAAWRLKQNPKLRIIIGSHNQSLATGFSLGIKEDYHESEAQRQTAEAEQLKQDQITVQKGHHSANCEFCEANPQPCPREKGYLAAQGRLKQVAETEARNAEPSYTPVPPRRVNPTVTTTRTRTPGWVRSKI